MRKGIKKIIKNSIEIANNRKKWGVLEINEKKQNRRTKAFKNQAE